MGVYYKWLCDERREYFDPGELLGPKCPQDGYGIKASSIPYSAWVVGLLMTEHWLYFATSWPLANMDLWQTYRIVDVQAN